MTAQKTTHHFVTLVGPDGQDQWNQPFNSVLFINYDINFSVFINAQLEIPPALEIADVVGNKLIPGTFEISLNAGEINTTNFKIDFNRKAVSKFVISWTEYAEHG